MNDNKNYHENEEANEYKEANENEGKYKNDSERMDYYVGIGLALGVVFGIILDNITLGVSIGFAVGVVMNLININHKWIGIYKENRWIKRLFNKIYIKRYNKYSFRNRGADINNG